MREELELIKVKVIKRSINNVISTTWVGSYIKVNHPGTSYEFNADSYKELLHVYDHICDDYNYKERHYHINID